MRKYVSPAIRKQVSGRANSCCEYCLMYEAHSFIKFQIEHIISLKHGGKSELDNLAYSCFYCNSFKGSDIASYTEAQILTRLYHPREDRWTDHFQLEKEIISPKSDIGKVTVSILGLNKADRLIERRALIEAKAYPHSNAIHYLELQ